MKSILDSRFLRSKWACLLTLALAYLLFGAVLPWWSLVAPSFAAGAVYSLHLMVHSKEDRTRDIGFAAAAVAAIVWLTLALVQDHAMEWRLSARLSGLFSLPSRSLLYLFVALIPAIVAGLSACLGATIVRIPRARREATQKPSGK